MENKVDLELQLIFSTLPKTRDEFEDIEERRKLLFEQMHKKQLPHNPNVVISERYIEGQTGAPPIRIKMYEPVHKKGYLPGLLWIHGGGFLFGAPEMDDDLCQRFALEANCLVVSVDYRLAPEHPFPAALEDCYTTLNWLFNNAKELGVDNERLAIAGASAGGGLTAGVTLMARDRNGPPLIFQMPLYPMIDDRNSTPSSYEITDSRVWNRAVNKRAWKLYLEDKEKTTEVSYYAAPSRATDLSRLPPTYTCIGTLDVFRDETIDYVTRLSQAGVPTEFHLYPGGFHAFEVMCPEAKISQRAIAQYVDALKRAFE